MMRWVMWALIVIVPGGMLFYLLGCLILRQKPWDFLYEQVPLMYDGKEPFDVWQAKMEAARKAQREEERGGD